MKDALPQTIYLKDYQVSPFLVDTTDLVFDLGEEQTRVTSSLQVRRNPDSTDKTGALELNSKGQVQLQWIAVNGQRLDSSAYSLSDDLLILPNLPDSCEISTEVLIQPQLNTSMMGLYRSRTMYCTQCEAEGYRKITFGLDRPDVLSTYTVTLSADKASCPVLL
ncbi:MAG: aminopeptidase N, partial [Porticoccaceae bacterium]